MKKLSGVAALATACVLALGAAPAQAASGSGGGGTGGGGTGGGGGGGSATITSAVSGSAVCSSTSQMAVTLRSASRRTNEVEIFSTDLRGGYWTVTLRRQGDGGLLSGFAAGYPEITGGGFIRITNSVNGLIPKGTSTVSFVAQRSEVPLDAGVPVLESCQLQLTVTAK